VFDGIAEVDEDILGGVFGADPDQNDSVLVLYGGQEVHILLQPCLDHFLLVLRELDQSALDVGRDPVEPLDVELPIYRVELPLLHPLKNDVFSHVQLDHQLRGQP